MHSKEKVGAGFSLTELELRVIEDVANGADTSIHPRKNDWNPRTVRSLVEKGVLIEGDGALSLDLNILAFLVRANLVKVYS